MARHVGKEPLPVFALAAIARRSRALGNGGKLLWRIPEDLARFRKITLGQTILMGRTTFEEIGYPLPDRRTIVLTRDPAWRHRGVDVARCLTDAIELANRMGTSLYVVGGGRVYRELFPFLEELLLTLVDDDPEADAFFPEFETQFKEVTSENWISPERGPPFRFSTWIRRTR